MFILLFSLLVLLTEPLLMRYHLIFYHRKPLICQSILPNYIIIRFVTHNTWHYQFIAMKVFHLFVFFTSFYLRSTNKHRWVPDCSFHIMVMLYLSPTNFCSLPIAIIFFKTNTLLCYTGSFFSRNRQILNQITG